MGDVDGSPFFGGEVRRGLDADTCRPVTEGALDLGRIRRDPAAIKGTYRGSCDSNYGEGNVPRDPASGRGVNPRRKVGGIIRGGETETNLPGEGRAARGLVVVEETTLAMPLRQVGEAESALLSGAVHAGNAWA